jgi:hypothetical protein
VAAGMNTTAMRMRDNRCRTSARIKLSPWQQASWRSEPWPLFQGA